MSGKALAAGSSTVRRQAGPAASAMPLTEHAPDRRSRAWDRAAARTPDGSDLRRRHRPDRRTRVRGIMSGTALAAGVFSAGRWTAEPAASA